jgi:metal-dependent amidase/aminoacylase/carboxypeptidase family protein
MLFLGAGDLHPTLHNPDYDFPDELIPIGARIFARVVKLLLEPASDYQVAFLP